MRAFSNAFFNQVEVVQRNRWVEGPLELVFVPMDSSFPAEKDGAQLHLALHDWNQAYAAGHIRPTEAFDLVTSRVPGIEHRSNPNIILAPVTPAGVSELHIMLASLLPDSVLAQERLERVRANMGLVLFGRHDLVESYRAIVERAFARVMWSKIAPRRRFNPDFFSKQSPLRLLAADTRFWMNRIYRIALERRESLFSSVRDDEEKWTSMAKLQQMFDESVPEAERSGFFLRRPLMGGTIWDENDAAERDAVLEDAISGVGVMHSLEPVIELLQRQRAHEDFSSRASWIKEDFERAFYSKRAKLKVELVETLDDAPVWSTDECDGYGEVLFRDLVAALDIRERRLLLALRLGKTVTEVASDEGLNCHASISRRITALKTKIARLLH